MEKSIPLFPEFAAITRTMETEIRNQLEAAQPRICEHSMGYIFGYAENLPLKAARLNNNICIYEEKINAFMLPIGGKEIANTIKECLLYFIKFGKPGRISAVPSELALELQKNSSLKATDDRNNYDYVYLVRDLIDLAGSQYQAKRNFAQQFIRRYDFKFQQLDKTLVEKCLELHEQWCDLKGCRVNDAISLESRFVYKLLNEFERLGLFGAAIIINDRVEAFTVAEKLNKDTAAIHIEKANTEFRGIYQAINNLFCREFLKEYTFVNREQDDGKPGLKKAKLSYYPVKFIEKSIIELH